MNTREHARRAAGEIIAHAHRLGSAPLSTTTTRFIELAIEEAANELRHTISQLRAALEDASDALKHARQESFFVREYMDEARAWLKAILEEAEAFPHTREEWRDGLCRGKIESVMGLCKAALSEIPEGGEVVFIVRQRLADGEKAGIEPSTERLTGGDQLTGEKKYASPPARTRLTDDELKALAEKIRRA